MSNSGVPLFDDMNAFEADSIKKDAFRLFNVERYSFPSRITIQVQKQKMTCFPKTIWNLEINSNTLRDIDKIKLYAKLNRTMTTRKYSRLCTMKLQLWQKIFFKKCWFFEKYLEFLNKSKKHYEVLVRKFH